MELHSGEKRENRRSSRFVKGMSVSKPPNNDGSGILAILLHPLSTMLLCFPVGMYSYFTGWSDVYTFWFNFAALVPLAKILGDATEELAAGLQNDMLAGLLNATFGNAVEMVIMVQTLRKDLLDVVKATLLGSVLSNLLLVLGMSFFCGGLINKVAKKTVNTPLGQGITGRATLTGSGGQGIGGGRMSTVVVTTTTPVDAPVDEEGFTEFVGEKVQTFSVMTALVNTSMLLLSCLSFSLVTVFYSETHGHGEDSMDDVILPVSRTCSIIIMLAYVAYIFFQLVTHREAMSEEEGDCEDEPEEPALSIGTSVAVMLSVTFVVAFASEMLVASLEGVVADLGVSQHFIGIVLLPIVGNACEHASAIRFAIMDKPGLSIGIAVGSSTQISLFVVPFAVLCGWAIDKPMDLNFGNLNVTVMSISVVVVLSVVVDGMANWLQGYLLMSAYFVVAILYWYLPNREPLES